MSETFLYRLSGQRPYFNVSVGEKTKKTEFGRWSAEKEQWCFQDILMLDVCPSDEICLCLQFSQEYDLLVAMLSFRAQYVGEVCFHVAS